MTQLQRRCSFDMDRVVCLILMFSWTYEFWSKTEAVKSKPRTVPHAVTNDVYMDPCKAKAFVGDIALTEWEYAKYEHSITVSNQTLYGLFRRPKYDKHFVNLILDKLTSSRLFLRPSDRRINNRLRSYLSICFRKYQKQHRKHGIRRFVRCTKRRIERWQKYLKHSKSNQSSHRHRRAATARPERLWRNGIIPYEIQANFSGNHKAMFKMAMRHWENYTCITFVERQNHHPNYIVFTERSCGCCSFVGKRGNGPQAVSIGKNCDKFGIVVHELGHVIGFWHEHTRPDRDNHVQIVYKNIQPGQEYNFNKLTENEVNSLGEDYDFGSIMHYARNTFARAIFLDTILPQKKPGSVVRPEIGQRVRLSSGDIRQANKLYKCAKCGRTLQESKATFYYTPESSQHDRDQMCEWRISATHGEKIILKFSVLDIPESPHCELDFLEVRDGYFVGSKLLGRYCGRQKVPLTLMSSDSRMWLGFKSTRGRGKGFIAHYEAVCGGDIIKEQGHLTSPNYPDDYKSHKDCVWKISVPETYQVALNFQSFEIENHDNCVYDYLEIRDGHSKTSPIIGRYCGYKVPDDVKSSKNKMYVKFVSDSSVQKRGFAATFVKEYDECTTDKHGCDHKCVNTLGSFKCECNIGYELHSDGKKCEDACGGFIDAPNGTFQTPSYPDFYPANKNCVWQIVAPEQYRITVNFTHFDLEGNNQDCEYDSLEVKSGVGKNAVLHAIYCGSTLPSPITSEGNTLRLEFKSDNSVKKTGFNAFFFTDKDECSKNNGNCQHICENTLGSYRCSCHNGYTLHDNQHDCKEGGCQHTLKDSEGEITSPNWPDDYPSRKNCVWSFSCKPGHRIKLVFSRFQLESQPKCTYDRIKVYDGPFIEDRMIGQFCGSKIPTPSISSSNHMYMTFESDASVQRKGFHAKYTTVCGGVLQATTRLQEFYSHAKYGDHHYMNREECQWHIQAKATYVIKLNFKVIDIEEDTDCGYDKVKVYNGDSVNSFLIGSYCGRSIPSEITSTKEHLVVEFSSDDTINGKGFKATYYMVKPTSFSDPRQEVGETGEIVVSSIYDDP